MVVSCRKSRLFLSSYRKKFCCTATLPFVWLAAVSGAAGKEAGIGPLEPAWSCLTIVLSSDNSASSLVIRACRASGLSFIEPFWSAPVVCAEREVAQEQIASTPAHFQAAERFES